MLFLHDDLDVESSSLASLCSDFITQNGHLFDWSALIRRLPVHQSEKLQRKCSAEALKQIEDCQGTTDQDLRNNKLWITLFALRWPNLSISKQLKSITSFVGDVGSPGCSDSTLLTTSDYDKQSFKQLYWQRHVIDCMNDAFEKYYRTIVSLDVNKSAEEKLFLVPHGIEKAVEKIENTHINNGHHPFFNVTISHVLIDKCYMTPDQYTIHIRNHYRSRMMASDNTQNVLNENDNGENEDNENGDSDDEDDIERENDSEQQQQPVVEKCGIGSSMNLTQGHIVRRIHAEEQTIGQIMNEYGKYVNEVKISNYALEICSIYPQLCEEIHQRLLNVRSVEFHDLRDTVSKSIIHFLSQSHNLRQLKILHAFLSEESMNSFLFDLIKQVLLSRGVSPSLLASNLYPLLIQPVYDKGKGTAVPAVNASTKNRQEEKFDLYSDLFDDNDEDEESVRDQAEQHTTSTPGLKRRRSHDMMNSEISQKRMKMDTVDIINQLESLCFYSTTLHPSSCELLGELLMHTKCLSRFICSDNRLNNQSVDYILKGLQEGYKMNQTTIKELRITENFLSDDILSTVTKGLSIGEYLSHLRVLDLASCDLSGKGLFPHLINISIQEISLSDNPLSNDTCIELCQFLESDRPTQFIHIDLSNCELKPRQTAMIFNSLARCNHVRAMNLDSNDAFMQTASIARCLSANTSIEVLDIGHCSLTEISQELEEALVRNTTLKLLRINGNKLHDAGAAAIARIISNKIKNASHLEDGSPVCYNIDLSANRITNNGGQLLLESIMNCPPSTKIMHAFDLMSNFLSVDLLDTWQNHLSEHKSKINKLLITHPALNVSRYFEPCDGVTAT